MSPQLAETWFRQRRVDFSRPDEFRGCLDDLSCERLDAILVENVYGADYMTAIAARLQRHDPPFFIFPPNAAHVVPRFRHLFGITLVAAGANMAEYFRVAAEFREHSRQLFQNEIGFEERMCELFSRASNGCSATVPRNADGQIYMPATIRILPNGSGIDLHCDNNLGHYPTYNHLRTICEVDRQLSYFLTINAPDAGGQLVFYKRHWCGEDDQPGKYEMSKNNHMVEECPSIAVNTRPGSVIIHAGGRIYHRVSETVGHHPRYTMGGFLAKSLQGDTLHYWS